MAWNEPDIKYILVVMSTSDSEIPGYMVGNNGVTHIKDTSAEFETGVYSSYEVYREDKLVAKIENCPVVIEYFE